MTAVFNHGEFDHHEQIVFAHDYKAGLQAIIGIHDTTLGPAAGGVRMSTYHTSDDALTDVLRLSRGMSYKNALAGLALGGGKAVLIGNPRTDKSPELLASLGKAINHLGGRYLAAEDVGMTVVDMEEIAGQTAHVFGRDPKAGYGGEPSPMTALGVLLSIQSCVKYTLGRNNLDGIRVAIQGAGAVGTDLARRLGEEGAQILIADVDPIRAQAAADKARGQVIGIDQVLSADVDVLAPCALGAVINDASIGSLRTKIVCGAANNQLSEPRHGVALAQRGILYAPDYVVNAGGIINVSYEVGGSYDSAKVIKHIQKIPQTLEAIFATSARESLPPDVVADKMAQRLIGRGTPP
ncbi:Glu/Leu/Phe/Val dehydrogenase family protein [Candidatus Phycosocius spiralis]|uniref:Leucine dehydrogenase n=1 Tax=Candidatus Phycosocius spiralis TaxID=2815099 RepID=A0ABQ4PUB0_9PROT|nr:Glu/Leu/Phe/Val dehydrogenase family protein [Candidatus Phycosocius spiralis]GIU66617.1 leucine dehydrogenase [Candidatus Phycosocius spiralis]